jgi:ribose transport system substrate-binding protein
MKRKVLLQLVFPLLGLSALFLILTFEPMLASRPAPPLELSVLLREADSSVSSAVRQGMEQAAADLGAELRFLSLSTANDAEEQRQLLLREVEGGADGVLLSPAERAELAQGVRTAAGRAAVVTLETDMSAQGAVACVGADNTALGEELGRAALHGVSSGDTVLLVDSLPGDTGIAERLEAAADVMEAAGARVCFCRPTGSDSLEKALTKAVEEERPVSVLAFEASALERAAQTLQLLEAPPLLYGVGATSAIAAGLEKGQITAVAAQNEFAAGYLAVEAAVKSIREEPVQDITPLKFSILRKENMYEPDNQKLLLPVIR